MGKHKKNKKKEVFSKSLFIVTGISDVYCSTNSDGAKFGVGNTYLLGTYNTLEDAVDAVEFLNSDEYELSGAPLDIDISDDTFDEMNHIIIEKVRADDGYFTGPKTLNNIDERWIFTFIDLEDRDGFYKLINEKMAPHFHETINRLLESNEFYDILHYTAINFNNKIFEIVGESFTTRELNEDSMSEFEGPSICNPDDEELKDIMEDYPTDTSLSYKDLTDDDVKDVIKDFLFSDSPNSMTIGDKKLKTPEDVDALSHDELKQAKELLLLARDTSPRDMLDRMDDFFNI